MTRLPAIALVLALAGCASMPPAVDARTEAKQMTPPYGYIGLCLRAECRGGTDAPVTVTMDAGKWSEINQVNDWVNRNIPEYSDKQLFGRSEYWAIATGRGGDCEDLALLKQKMLRAKGWPMSALLIAEVREWNGDGHAVLLVITDAGALVLDNKTWKIERLRDAPYTLVKRQTRRRPYVWTDARPDEAPAISYPPIGEPPFVGAARKMKEMRK